MTYVTNETLGRVFKAAQRNTREIQRVFDAPDVRNLAKDTLREALTKDPVDAIADLELVLRLLKQRLAAYGN